MAVDDTLNPDAAGDASDVERPVGAPGDAGAPTSGLGSDPAPHEPEDGVEQVPGEERELQPHEWSPPDEPARSGGGPQDALEPRHDAGQGVPNVKPAAGDHPGPEDAMDPHGETAGDYTGRVEDGLVREVRAVERHGGDEPKPGEPLTEPVAQNRQAIESLEHAEPAGDDEHSDDE